MYIFRICKIYVRQEVRTDTKTQADIPFKTLTLILLMWRIG